MKTFLMNFSLLLVLFVFGISIASAQVDIASIKPAVDANHDPCAFNFTFTNHNIQGKNIDGVRFELLSVIPNGGLVLEEFQTPLHWTSNQLEPNSTIQLDATSNDAGIAPGASLGGFILPYDIDFDMPVTIRWVTLNAGVGLDSAEVNLYCTQYQSYDKIDTMTVIPSQNGPDPCFTFTLINRNSQGGAAKQTTPIQYVSFEILNGGTMRPSKITPPPGWVLDSVTTSFAYFSTPNALQSNDVAAPFIICLRANPTVNKFTFVWRANDPSNQLIDRDTLFNIPNTATGSPLDADIVVASKPNGCLFNVTLKNYHAGNTTLAPSRIIRFILSSKTPGVTFASAPGAPASWTKVITSTGDSVIYTADSLPVGVPSGTLAQFSFGMNGPTTAGFSLAWETDQAAAPFPPKFSLVSTGTLNLTCTAAVPATDSAFFTALTACSFKLTVKNTHNIVPESNLTQVTISIPNGSGQLTPTGTSATPPWDFTSPSTTTIKFTASPGDPGMPPDPTASQDLTFSLTPKVPGQPITATWTTTDDKGSVTGTGTGPIVCTPAITICDTFRYDGIEDPVHNTDSCRQNIFVLRNKKTANIQSLTISSTNGWLIDSVGLPIPARWNLTGPNQRSSSMTFQSTEGLAPGDSSIFHFKFYGCFTHDKVLAGTADTFSIVSVTTDVLGKMCTDISHLNLCRALICDLGVSSHSDNIGVNNFAVHPNPAHGMAEITFDVTTQEHITIGIIDQLGHQNTTVASKVMGPGTYQIPCLLNNLPDGVYYIRIETALGVKTVKLVLTK